MGSPNRALRWAGVALVACGVSSAAPARADEPLPPVTPYIYRGWLYGAGQGGFFWSITTRSVPIGGSVAETSISVGLGITDRLSLDASLGTLSVAPEVRLSSPQVGVWLGIVDTPPLELDATTHFTFGVGGEPTLATYEPGLVAVVRPGWPLRLDAGAYLPVTVDGGVGLRAPLALALQLNQYFHAQVRSGVTLSTIGEGSVAFPFGLALGCSVPLGSGGYAVVLPTVAWPRLNGGLQSEPGGVGFVEIGAILAIITPSP